MRGLKKGDKVVFVKDANMGLWSDSRESEIPIGAVGVITSFSSLLREEMAKNILVKKPVYIKVKFNFESRWDYWFNHDELELFEGCNLKRVTKLSSLKIDSGEDGVIETLILS